MREWKRYKRAYVRFAQTRPDTKRLLADYRPEIDQIWIPEMGVVDRCTTCHQGIAQPSLLDASVPQPFRAHPPIPHRVARLGLHDLPSRSGRGNGSGGGARNDPRLGAAAPARAFHPGLLRHLPPRRSSGNAATRSRPPTLMQLNCVGCHRLQDVDRPDMLGPDLTNIGTKVSRQWIYKWLKEPRTVTDGSGNTTVNGYDSADSPPRMPQFHLTEQELRALSAYLSTQRAKPIEPYHFDPRVVSALGKQPDLADQGEVRFRQMFCSTCHSLAVTRAGETKLIGGDIGPELTKVGSKVNADWLVAWLRDPQAYLPHSKMPRYQWSDEDLYKVTQYITTRLTDSDLLADVPQLGAPTAEEIQLGRRLFVDKGCASCHVIEGIAATGFRPRPFRAGREGRFAALFWRLQDSAQPDCVHPGQDHQPLVREFGGAHAALPLAARRSRRGNDGSPEYDGRSRHRGGLQKLFVPRTEAAFVPPENSAASMNATSATSATSSTASAARWLRTFPTKAAGRSGNG